MALLHASIDAIWALLLGNRLLRGEELVTWSVFVNLLAPFTPGLAWADRLSLFTTWPGAGIRVGVPVPRDL